MSDDLERTIRDSLEHHARSLGGRPAGHLDQMWSRLDRRRNRRRSVAAVGSVIAVGAGVAGIAMVGAPDDAPAAGDGAPMTTFAGVAWRCTDFFAGDLTYRYYRSCTPVAELPPLDQVATTFPGTLAPFTTSVPFTVVPSTAEAPANTEPVASVGTTVPFVTVPPFATTAPPLTDLTTTTVAPPGAALVPPTTAWGAVIDSLPGSPTTAPMAPTATAATTIVAGAGAPGGVCQDVSGDAPVTVPCPTDSPVIDTGPAAGTVPTLPAAPGAFRCTGLLGVDAAAEYLAMCETIGPDGAVEPQTALTTTTFPPSTAPVTVVGTAAPENTAPPTTITHDADGRQIHVIQLGDSPASVAMTYGISVEDLTAANDADVMDRFIVGTTLIIPAADPISMGEQAYVVQEGDSLARIADRYGVTMWDIANYNAWDDGFEHMLMVGDTILIPPGARATTVP